MNEFLENSYIKKLLDAGYIEVKIIDLPDGDYHKYGSGYQFSIHTDIEDASFSGAINPTSHTGYTIVTEEGIRGTWSGVTVYIKDGSLIGGNVYKIMTNSLNIIREKKIKEILK